MNINMIQRKANNSQTKSAKAIGKNHQNHAITSEFEMLRRPDTTTITNFSTSTNTNTNIPTNAKVGMEEVGLIQKQIQPQTQTQTQTQIQIQPQAKVKVKTKSTPVVVATNKKRRKVSFKVGFTGDIFEIPHNDYDTQNTKNDLFYSDADYDRFKASEQKRYNKLVAKKIQQMVHEKMQPAINEAVANGATLEDIEAMVPKTHAQMVAYLGGEKTIMKTAAVANAFGGLGGKGNNKRTIRSSRSSIETPTNTNDTNINDTGTGRGTTLVSASTVMMAAGKGGFDSQRSIRCTRSSIRSSITTTSSDMDIDNYIENYIDDDANHYNNINTNGAGGNTTSVAEAAAAATAAAVEMMALGEE